MGTVYAACTACGHVEPRPEHALEDWRDCENCRADSGLVEPFDDEQRAFDALEQKGVVPRCSGSS